MRVAKQWRATWSQITGKHDDLLVTILRYGQLNTRRSNHVPGVDQARLDTACDFKRLVVFDWRDQWPQLTNI